MFKIKKSNKKISSGYKKFDYGEICRQLRTNIEYSSFEKKLQVVNFTSTNPGEGKSDVISNLAIVSVPKYQNVLLMDCDLRKPVQHKIFNVSNKTGISDIVLDLDKFDVNDDTFFQKFRQDKIDGTLFLLTSGTKVPNPQELLASDKFKELLSILRTRFEFILLDCPPVSAVADAIPLSVVADGTVFVISARETNKNEAKIALTQLQRNGANVLGAALTNVEHDGDSYYGYYNYSETEIK
ncbi:MAG: CpsD/CapB family tyrosine-protein kinase [Erysipelotrichaceae bacterium]